MLHVKKLRVGVIYGGRSGEHEVSLASAAAVFSNLDPHRYEAIPIRIEKDGRWTLPDRPPTLVSAADVIAGRARPRSRRGAGARSAPGRASRRRHAHHHRSRQRSAPSSPASRSTSSFPVLHGPYGEDGTVQGLLELANVPYVGAGVLASAVGMDKAAMKLVFAARGLPICDYDVVLAARLAARRARRSCTRSSTRLGFPVFVKPANLGSSVGISKAKHAAELRAAIDLAAEFDRKIVIEAAVPERARDRVRGARQRRARGVGAGRGHPVARVLRLRGEVPRRRLADASFPRRSRRRRPTEVRRLAIAAFKAVDCAGMARVDFLLDGDSGDALPQRDQHHPRLHDDQHVLEDVGGERSRVSGAARSPHRARDRASRRKQQLRTSM